MTDHEKYSFDINGYLVIENALSASEVEALNEAVENNRHRIRVRDEEHSLARGSSALVAKHGRGDLGGFLTWEKPWCQPFRDLVAHPTIVPYLTELLHEGFRLDHLYGIITWEGAEGHTLHGGGTADDLTHFYQVHNGRIRNGLTVVSWMLSDCTPGDGGFACIPGSHKANFRCPPDVSRLETDLGLVSQVEAPAGSAVIFTEALTHGTLPWKAEHERRSILYKYSPGPLTYSRAYRPQGVEDVLDEFTPAQRAVLEPPYRTNRPDIAGE